MLLGLPNGYARVSPDLEVFTAAVDSSTPPDVLFDFTGGLLFVFGELQEAYLYGMLAELPAEMERSLLHRGVNTATATIFLIGIIFFYTTPIQHTVV